MLDKMLIRSYTPTNPILPLRDDTPETVPKNKWSPKAGNRDIPARDDNPRDGDGTFELVIKTYFPTDQQPGGAMTNLLDCMLIGESVEIRGPTGEIEYQGSGKFLIDGKQCTFRHVSLVLGGSGVTPGYALMARVAVSGDQSLDIQVVDANSSEGDILLRSEMEELEDKSKGRIKITHVLSHPPES